VVPSTVAAVLFSLAGGVMLLASVLSFAGTRRFVRAAAAATGTVKRIALDECVSPEGAVYYCVVVEFADATGAPVEVRWVLGTTPPPYRIGQQLPLLYDTHNPRHATIRSFTSIWFGFLTLFGLGAAFAGGGVALFLAG
jgi:hypothetical protein